MAELADAAQSELGKVELGEGTLQGKPSALSLATPSLGESEGYISHRPSEDDLEAQRHGGCPSLPWLAEGLPPGRRQLPAALRSRPPAILAWPQLQLLHSLPVMSAATTCRQLGDCGGDGDHSSHWRRSAKVRQGLRQQGPLKCCYCWPGAIGRGAERGAMQCLWSSPTAAVCSSMLGHRNIGQDEAWRGHTRGSQAAEGRQCTAALSEMFASKHVHVQRSVCVQYCCSHLMAHYVCPPLTIPCSLSYSIGVLG